MRTKSPLFLILGTLLIAVSLMLRQFTHLPDFVLGFITGVAIGVIVLGIIKMSRWPYKGDVA